MAAIPLGDPLPERSSNLPESDASHAMLPYLVLLRMGFTVPSAVTVDAVSSYLAVSPLPDPRGVLLPH